MPVFMNEEPTALKISGKRIFYLSSRRAAWSASEMQLQSCPGDQWRSQRDHICARHHVMIVQQIFRSNVEVGERIKPPRDERIEFEVRIQCQRVAIVVKDRTVAASLKCDRHEPRIAVASLKSELVTWGLWNL